MEYSQKKRFIESLTSLGSDVLIPVNRIKYVFCTYTSSCEIRIVSDDDTWTEFFNDVDELEKRYKEIKSLLG